MITIRGRYKRILPPAHVKSRFPESTGMHRHSESKNRKSEILHLIHLVVGPNLNH